MGHEGKRFENANEELYGTSLKINRLLSVFMPFITALLNLGIVAVLYYGGIQVFTGIASVGQIMAFINYLSIAMFSVIVMGSMAGQISAAEASATRINQVLDEEPDIKEKSGAVKLDDVKGHVVFEDVSFTYGNDGGAPVLTDISFSAEPGEMVAILGATGSGKSTLVHLIPRFYDVTGGSVSIDGVDVRNVSIESLRSSVGISLQESILFSGTIRDSIRYGRSNASEEDVIEAAKAAQAHEFIMSSPNGYDTIVGQVETEIKIEEALKEIMRESTKFVIAQRISTVLNADKILVLEDGRIAAEGNHSQLMETSPIYRDIYDSQLGGGVKQ